MKTDELINLLAKDSDRPWAFRSVLAAAVGGGIIIAAILFFVGIGFRPDISEAVKSDRFLFKFVVTKSRLAGHRDLGRARCRPPGGSLAHRGLAPGDCADAAGWRQQWSSSWCCRWSWPMDDAPGRTQRALLPDPDPLALDRPARLSAGRVARGRHRRAPVWRVPSRAWRQAASRRPSMRQLH